MCYLDIPIVSTRAARFAILPNGKLRLPKIGNVAVRWSRELPSAPSSVTVIRAVHVEDLMVRGMARGRLAKSVHDAGWSTFVTMLEYKAKLYGREFTRIGRFEPTSQVCSACGFKDGRKPLHVREWSCRRCGAVHDRDVNAAKNILAAGRAERRNACRGDASPGATLADASEAGSHRSAA
jgi:putative transposase